MGRIDAIRKGSLCGTWVAKSVERLTLAQVMISRLMSLSSTSGSVLTAQSLEPAYDSVSPSLSPPTHSYSVSVSPKNKHYLKNLKSKGTFAR